MTKKLKFEKQSGRKKLKKPKILEKKNSRQLRGRGFQQEKKTTTPTSTSTSTSTSTGTSTRTCTGTSTGMNGHFCRDPDLISRLPGATSHFLSVFIGFEC